ncbi:MAG: T9SS type A sorting domain-containing protein [Bacteroidetes bacterium]|nr:T9SS type A sorting domain-containing protein [Bacteroidota bacterium]
MKTYITPKNILCSFILLAGITFTSRAATITAIANGRWSSPDTWDVHRAPADNDTVVIYAGTTVTVDINSHDYAYMAVCVLGTLNFDGGQKLNICPAGCVIIYDGGLLTGDNPGAKINICGTTDWTGPDTATGPVGFGNYPNSGYTGTGPTVHTVSGVQDKATANSVIAKWSSPIVFAGDVFTIERSENGLTFETIGTVNSTGFSMAGTEYSFEDKNPLEGSAYYRVTQSNKHGLNSTSDNAIAERTINNSGCSLKVFPNPCTDDCQINFTDCPGDNDGVITVDMIDANGAVVSSQIAEQNANGGFNLHIDRSNNLAPGVYIVRGTSSKNAYMQKAILK